MLNSRRTVLQVIGCLAMTGCASHSTIFNRPVATEEVPRLLADSPHVTPLSARTYAQRTEPTSIQFFNYGFNPLNRPDLVKEWQYHYVVGPASEPAWPYERLAQVLVYLRNRDDATALPRLGAAASSLGGDAVVDLHRKPVITRKPPAPIDAYMYYGVVVRKTD